jgi:hypothetical protein
VVGVSVVDVVVVVVVWPPLPEAQKIALFLIIDEAAAVDVLHLVEVPSGDLLDAVISETTGFARTEGTHQAHKVLPEPYARS